VSAASARKATRLRQQLCGYQEPVPGFVAVTIAADPPTTTARTALAQRDNASIIPHGLPQLIHRGRLSPARYRGNAAAEVRLAERPKNETT
jgi:hypothetical protein